MIASLMAALIRCAGGSKRHYLIAYDCVFDCRPHQVRWWVEEALPERLLRNDWRGSVEYVHTLSIITGYGKSRPVYGQVRLPLRWPP